MLDKIALTRLVVFDNYEIEKLEVGHVLVTTVVGEESLNIFGTAHGGYLFALCDEVGGLSAMTTGVSVVTQQANINYLRAALPGERVSIEGMVSHNGRRTKLVEVTIRNQASDILAKVSLTMFVTGQLSD